MFGRLSALRRDLHRAAEIGLQLPRTQALVADALAEVGLEIALGSQLTSVVGVLRADRRRGRSRPCCCGATWTRCR